MELDKILILYCFLITIIYFNLVHVCVWKTDKNHIPCNISDLMKGCLHIYVLNLRTSKKVYIVT